MGNITAVYENGVLTERYTYDKLNQLARADVAATGKTTLYWYDKGGNIGSRREYPYTTADYISGQSIPTRQTSYGYTDSSWKDLMTSYDGQTITYDGMGNPLNYRDGISFTWKNGRRMDSSTVGSIVTTYDYDIDGNRVYRAGAGYRRKYTVIDGVTWGEQITFNGKTHSMEYMRDENGDVYGFIYDGSTYFLEKNALGDVKYLLNASGNVLAKYTYDEWGKKISVTDASGNDITDGTNIAHLNPFRYRSYYYDDETGLYYLGSRYYDPQIGRWISPEPNVYASAFDCGAGLTGYNVYAYCANNPVNFFDPTGEFVISTLLICVVAGAIIGGTVGGIVGNAYANRRGYTGWNKTKCILAGIGIGGVAGGVAGYFVAPLVVSATGVAGISVTSAGISTVAAVGTSFGKLGTLIVNNGHQIVDWGKTTWHGIQRMAERGVTQGMVESWVKTGKALQQSGGKILYITRQGAVVVNKAGQVITAYTSKYFDANMWETVKKLFGK